QVLDPDQLLDLVGGDARALVVLDLELFQVREAVIGRGHTAQLLVVVGQHQPGPVHVEHRVSGLHDLVHRVEDAMHEIVQTTHAMFDVDGAGLMLTDHDQQLRSVAASDDRLAHLEELQIEHDEGPCIAAYEDKQLVGVEDLISDTRWPKFGDAAVSRQVRAVLASPLPYNQDAVGVVTVVSAKSRPWTPEGELALLAFTDLAALLIASMMQNQEKSELATQLQGALDSRQIIEQAKGVLVGRPGSSPRTAFEQLRAQARSERRKVSALCAEVVTSATKVSTARDGAARDGATRDGATRPS